MKHPIVYLPIEFRSREFDSKALLAYVLDSVAEIELDRGDAASAECRASEAASAARVVDHQSELAVARSILARARCARGDPSSAREVVQESARELDKRPAPSARALTAFTQAASLVGFSLGNEHEGRSRWPT